MFQPRDFCPSSSDESDSDQEVRQHFIKQSLSYQANPPTLPSLSLLKLSLSHRLSSWADPGGSIVPEERQATATLTVPRTLKKYQLHPTARGLTQTLVKKIPSIRVPARGTLFKLEKGQCASPSDVSCHGTPQFGHSVDRWEDPQWFPAHSGGPLSLGELRSFRLFQETQCLFKFIEDSVVLVAKVLDSPKRSVVFAESEHDLNVKKYIGQMTSAERGYLLCDIAQDMFTKPNFPNQLAYIEFPSNQEIGKVVLPEVNSRGEYKRFPLSSKSKRLHDEIGSHIYVFTSRPHMNNGVWAFETFGGETKVKITLADPSQPLNVECVWPFSALQAFGVALVRVLTL